MRRELIRILKAFGYSLEGIRAAWRSEPAFRIEIVTAIAMATLACWLEVTAGELAILIFSLFLVLIAELINTAVETVVNRISEDIHPLSKCAKDVGSAIVLLSLLNAACVWGIVAF